MEFNTNNNQIKSSMLNYYKVKQKKKTDSKMYNVNNNGIYANDLLNKNTLKSKASLKFRTSKNSPVYTKRKIDVNEDTNSGLLTGGRVVNNNEDLFSKKIKKMYKKGQFSQLNDNSSNLMSNNSKNESASLLVNKFNKVKNILGSDYNINNFDYSVKLNQYLANNSLEENNTQTPNHNNISIKKKETNYISNLGIMKKFENKDNKISGTLFKKITNNKKFKNDSVTKIQKISNINYLNDKNKNNSIQKKINYSKYLQKYDENNMSDMNLIDKKINKILNPSDYSSSLLDCNKLSKTAYLSKNNSGKNSLEKKIVKNNFNTHCFNSKLIQKDDNKNFNNINNNNYYMNSNNNESSRVLYDSISKKKKTANITGANEKNKINEKEKEILLYNNCINSYKKQKHIYHIKSTSDINTNNYKIISNNNNNNNNNPMKSTQFSSLSNGKINSIQNLKLNCILNNKVIDNTNNSNSNKTNSNRTIHFKSNSNIYYNNDMNNNYNNNDININNYNDKDTQIYKKKYSLKQKEKLKNSYYNKDKSNSYSLIENNDFSGNKIKSARVPMPKQEIIKAKLIKNLLPFKNIQSPVEKIENKIIKSYMMDSQKIKENNQIINRDGDIDNENFRENKSAGLINNNYYIGINLDNKLINNICHTLKENNNYFNCNLISSNNNQSIIHNENNNFIFINNNNNISNSKSNNFSSTNIRGNNINEATKILVNNNEKEKDSKNKTFKHFNSQEIINDIGKEIKKISNKLSPLEINKKEKEKIKDKKKSDNNSKTTQKEKEKYSKDKNLNNNYNNDMLYIPPDKELKQETIHLTTTASLDCFYYKNEKEKLAQYIKNYHKETGEYPSTQKHFYLYGRQIGHGAFGKVNIALHVASGRLVAIKTFNKKNLKKKNARQKIKNEIEMLSRLRHPFINQILDSFETDTHIFIVMEYICGDLLGFIRKRGKLSETVSKIIFKQLIEGLKYIHHRKIVHRDIKLDNILIDLTNTIKICDFGVSRKISGDEVMHEHCGTPAYIAPEIFENQGYSGFLCDIWSAGVTLYYILGGIQPFRANSIKDLEKKVIKGEFDPIENVSEDANDLIKLMLKTDPKKRITINKILTHPWLSNIKTEHRKKLNLFTDAEKILLCKFDVDYLTSEKEDLIENFTMKNLETNESENAKNQNGGTKSVIYAPYNTYIEPNEDQSKYKHYKEVERIYKEIKIHNNICKYGFKVQQANIKYELSNNQDFDNGIIKTQKDEDLKQENEIIEKRDFKKSANNSFDNNLKAKSVNDSYEEDYKTIKINEKILNEIEKTVGYDKKYVFECLKKNIINYATATYYLLTREDE